MLSQFNPLSASVALTYKPVNLFAMQVRATLALNGLNNEFTPTVSYLYSDVRLIKNLNLKWICNDLFTSDIDFVVV